MSELTNMAKFVLAAVLAVGLFVAAFHVDNMKLYDYQHQLAGAKPVGKETMQAALALKRPNTHARGLPY